MIGDLQTAALVERGGSIDWLCFPRFDSGACFAALLGTPDNGRWLIAPRGEAWQAGWRYRPDTLVLETEWETDGGAVRVLDFMPPRGKAPDIVRIVEGVRGEVEMSSELMSTSPCRPSTIRTMSGALPRGGMKSIRRTAPPSVSHSVSRTSVRGR